MLSLNGAFSLLASWGLRARGVPVRYAVCQRGMEQCMLGTNWRRPEQRPPCDPCIAFSNRLFPSSLTLPVELSQRNTDGVRGQLEGRNLEQLVGWTYRDLPLGELCLPGLRWALRRHHLEDSETNRGLLRQYLRSAASLVERFESLCRRVEPRALVVFNGVTYPEAVARAVAESRGVPVVTHEVGLRPFSSFFSHHEATFRELALEPEYQLSARQQARLEAYLEQRRQGRFTMAGIRFWPEMQGLPQELGRALDRYQRRVVVFTNVIFDTSQVHANSLFADMFDWLDQLARFIRSHPDTLFILRMHPDEERPGKRSRQSVSDWARRIHLEDEENVVLLEPGDLVSSYQLTEEADLVLIYNSSIGLEASIMGAHVVSAGRARFTQADTVVMPKTQTAYWRALEDRLVQPRAEPAPEHRRNSRRFLHKELFEASLDLSAFLTPHPSMPGMVLLAAFEPHLLLESEELERIHKGVLHGEPFLLEEGDVSRPPGDGR